MMGRALLLITLAAPTPALAQSPRPCAWLTAGTAAKLLGADVASTAHSDSAWSGSCRFVSSTMPAASIDVIVSKTDSHRCGGNATPLTGIGNEAVLCSAPDQGGQNVQTVSGRVRERWFVVQLTMSANGSQVNPKRNEFSNSSPIEFLAEQIAGNLY